MDRRCDPPSGRDPNLGRGSVCGARRPDPAGRTLVGRTESAYRPGLEAAHRRGTRSGRGHTRGMMHEAHGSRVAASIATAEVGARLRWTAPAPSTTTDVPRQAVPVTPPLRMSQ